MPQSKNTTRYQRIDYLSSEFDLTIFTFDSLPSSLSGRCELRKCPDSLLFKLIFPLWVVYFATRADPYEPDFIHTSFHKPALLSGILLKLLGNIWICDFWDEPTLGMQLKRQRMWKHGLSKKEWLSYLYSSIAMLLIRPSLKWADLCIFVPDVYDKYGFSETDDNVLSVTNGVSFDSTIAENPVRRNKFTIFYVGSVQRSRGVTEIIDAAERLMSNNDEPLEFELVGPIPNEEIDWLDKKIREQGLDEVINLVGRVPHQEALDRMAHADICLCILSSDIRNYRNTYPIKIFEYMAMGRAIVCTDLPGTRQVINNRENGILVPPEDAVAISETIQSLLDDPQLRVEIGERAQQDVRNYDWNEINARIVEKMKLCMDS